MGMDVGSAEQWRRFCEATIAVETNRFEESGAPTNGRATTHAVISVLVRRNPHTLAPLDEPRIVMHCGRFEDMGDNGAISRMRFRSSARALCIAGDAYGAAMSAQVFGRETENVERTARGMIFFQHETLGDTLLTAPYEGQHKLGEWSQHEITLTNGYGHAFFEMLSPPNTGNGVHELLVEFSHLYVKKFLQDVTPH